MGQNAGTADVIYRFVYDALGRLVNVKLNDIPLLTNTYSADRLSQLISAIQGDGYRVHYKLLAVTGSMASTLGRQNPIRYRGYEYDEESGLYYLRSRYYNPDTGRFISADSVMGKVGEVLSHNLYCYCGNNPVSLIDKNGNIPQNGLVAYGTSCEIDLALSISIIEGVVEDSKGNVADFITYVGIPESWQIPQAVKSKDRHDPSAMGLGGIGISYSNVLITANNADIFDFSGPGSYIGGSVDAGLSIGVDALVFGKYLNEITDTEIISGYQISFGIGIGINWVHEGNAYTIIRLREDKGKPIPYEERYWQ